MSLDIKPFAAELKFNKRKINFNNVRNRIPNSNDSNITKTVNC